MLYRHRLRSTVKILVVSSIFIDNENIFMSNLITVLNVVNNSNVAVCFNGRSEKPTLGLQPREESVIH